MSIGTSTAASIPFVTSILQTRRPRVILDLGCGWGRWGCLAREFLELWDHRWSKDEWITKIYGVDINPNNWTPIHRYVYDLTVTADLRHVTPADDPFAVDVDLVLLTDVIEHLPKPDAWTVIDRWRKVCAVLIGVPIGPGWERGGFPDNDHEAHISEWHYEDLRPISSHSVLTQTEDPKPYGLFLLERTG